MKASLKGKDYFLFGWMCSHVLYILLVNLGASWSSYQAFYRPELPHRPGILERLLQAEPLQSYGLLTGTQYGYGFFAPNVGSQYVSRFRLYDAQGQLIASRDHPGLQMQQSLQRYSVFLDQFQRYLKEHEQESQQAKLYRRYLEASMTSMCQRMLERAQGVAKIECTVYLHQPPSLRESPNQGAKLIAIYSRTVEKSDRAESGKAKSIKL